MTPPAKTTTRSKKPTKARRKARPKARSQTRSKTSSRTSAKTGTKLGSNATSHGSPDTGAATIYEVNVRQYTPEGTFRAFEAHLPRLKDMGVGVLWLMPIHPIGKVGRKGKLGSYYAVRDYDAVNPEFGTMRDFKRLVDRAHDHDMRVIIDWVANHTACDHPWTKTHPERYTRADDGGFKFPEPTWTDTYELDFDEPSTHDAMLDAMTGWVERCDIDGFRCDVADMVGRAFWSRAIPALRRIKSIYMLAEGAPRWLHRVGFDATYGWDFGGLLHDVVAGQKTVKILREQLAKDAAAVGRTGARMRFTTNHDWNSWEGVARDRLGPAHDAAAVLAFTLPGTPMIYSGEEAGLDRAIEFFVKDQIDWRPHPMADLYRRLATLKRTEPALRSVTGTGAGAGSFEFLDVGNAPRVLAFRRRKGASEVTVLANLSPKPARVKPVETRGPTVDLHGFPADLPKALEPWSWALLRRVRA